MRSHLTALALATALASISANAQSPADNAPYYNAGSQYTASLDRTSGHWRLQPSSGQDIEINTGLCPTGTTVPVGLWLLVRDANGRPELLAPSTTLLPAGHSERLALRNCDEAGEQQLAVPQTLLDLLVNSTGAILVQDGSARD